MVNNNYPVDMPKTYTVSYFDETEWNKDLTVEEIAQQQEFTDLQNRLGEYEKVVGPCIKNDIANYDNCSCSSEELDRQLKVIRNIKEIKNIDKEFFFLRITLTDGHFYGCIDDGYVPFGPDWKYEKNFVAAIFTFGLVDRDYCGGKVVEFEGRNGFKEAGYFLSAIRGCPPSGLAKITCSGNTSEVKKIVENALAKRERGEDVHEFHEVSDSLW